MDFAMTEWTDLDDRDRQILDLLAADGRLSMTELADRVHLSRPAVQARVRRLEETGVIMGYSAQVRRPAGVAYCALLLARFTTRPCAPALAFLRSQPEVRRYWSVAGPWDAVVEVEVQDAPALSALIDRLAAWPGGISAESMTVLDDYVRPERETS
jgi:DNA-binding Lrp family transcriptional regulator